MHRFTPHHRGQSLAIVALFAVTLFTFMGLAIDGGMLYLERRHLQNVTDSACLAAATDIVMGRTTDQAIATAKTYVADNLGANGGLALNLPSPIIGSNQGSGTGLTHGVEIVNTSDVRVALRLPADTFFMRVGGIETYNVGARSHCDATAGGGITPLAVNRFPTYDYRNKPAGGGDTSVTLPQYSGNGKKPRVLKVLDVLQAGAGILNNYNGTADSTACGSDRRNWYGFPNPDGLFQTSCPEATPANPGPEAWLGGSGATPNMGDTSFSGPVVLDARQIGTTPTFYNDLVGAGTSLSAWKDTVFKYMVQQYPGPDIRQGEQLGYVSGISAGQLFPLIASKYKVGDTVTTLVYDGKVRARENFVMSLKCVATDNGSFKDCDTTATDPSKYVYHTPPPSLDSSFFSGGSACKYEGRDFIGDASQYPAGTHIPASTLFRPASYVVRLEQATSSMNVQLTARISGQNPGLGDTDDDFGKVKVRWNGGSWQAPNQLFTVSLLPNTPLDVTLEVIQTSTQTRTCTSGPTSVDYTVPRYVEGAQTVQVIGRAPSARHSDYGSLGMRNNSSAFAAGSYFLSFAGDPIGTLRGSGTFEAQMQFVDANSDPANETILDYGSLPAAGAPTITGLPAGATAAVVAGPGGDPVLRITVADGTAAGDYDIDVQWNSSPVHSTRFLLRVTDSSPSIDSWVVILCTARFNITYLDSNEMRGRAVSGCIDPADEQEKLLSTSRLSQW